MQDQELSHIWKSYEQKLDRSLAVNHELLTELTKLKVGKTIGRMRLPKKALLLFGIPYTVLLFFLAFIGSQADAFFVMTGFGLIAIIMSLILGLYAYQLYLIRKVDHSSSVIEVQEGLAHLKVSSFNTARLAVVQLPFWSVCWMSLDALIQSPFLYGGVNLIVFIGLAFLAYYLYKGLDIKQPNKKISELFLAGAEWEPILLSTEMLEHIEEFKKTETMDASGDSTD